MRDLLIQLPRGMRPRMGLEHELRTAIRSGRLAADAELPSTRALASDLGVARSTVVAAYEQLAVEGYLVARQGRSTVVAHVAIPDEVTSDRNPIGRQLQHDFRPGEPALGSFPRSDWQQSVRRTIMESADEVFGYGDPRGRLELREVLANYLARARVVHVDASAVRIYGGFASSLGFMGEMLRRQGIVRIGVEQPMLPFHRQILALTGVEPIGVSVDDEGLSVDELTAHDVQAVVVTPGNQQPLGVTMSSARRNDLIAWAASCDGWVIEDDYDGEFRYDRRPIGALQGLDPDRVIYAGTASKSMGPGLHLSWLVVPQRLRPDLDAVTQLRAGVSTLNQLAMADFIDRGNYDRHVRRQRRVYQQRRNALIERLEAVPWIAPVSGQAGMHVLARIPPGEISEATVIAAGERQSIGLIGLRTHFGHDKEGLVINVSRPANHQFAAALAALEELFANQPG